MDGVNADLLDAVTRLRESEDDVLRNRKLLAEALKRASANNTITHLSRLTKINRATIYWLINNWSTSENSNGRHRRRQG